MELKKESVFFYDCLRCIARFLMIFIVLLDKQSLQYKTTLQQIADAGQQHFGREGFGDIGIGTTFVTFYLVLA